MHTIETLQQRQLDRMRRYALGLLLLMAAGLCFAWFWQPRWPALGYLAAFTEAGLVGGLADWFAVTALFRHPFGVPVPHTAIIPRNKDRIGESIGNFLQNNFMTREVLRAELAGVDFAGATADWLANEVHSAEVAQQLARALPALVQAADDPAARELMRSTMAGALQGARLAPVLARLLDLLVAGRQHHVLLERILGIVARALDQNRPLIRQKVHENSPRWLPRAIDEKLFERILEGVQNLLLDIQADDSEWRLRFDQAARDMTARLATSDEYERKLHAMLAAGFHSQALQDYLGEVWRGLRARLLAACAAPDTQLVARCAAALRAFATALQADAAVRARLNAWLRAVVTDTIVERRDVIASIVWRVIRQWDADTVARKFELHVGKDLQYIRINGTLVGGAVGLMLHALAPAG